MEYKVDEIVVYPHHGVAKITGQEYREINGEEIEFLVLRILQSDLTVRVATKNADHVGVRDVVGEDGLNKVFSVLREVDVEEAGNWSRRYKANQERLASGDINKVAEVVRDLWRREEAKGLSAGEKRMLGKARHILVGELALAQPVDEKKAEQFEKDMAEMIARHAADPEKGGVARDGEDLDDVDLDDLSFDDED